MQFSLDYASFRSATPDSETVEIYHSIPYGELHYQAFGDTLRAVYQVKVTVEEILGENASPNDEARMPNSDFGFRPSGLRFRPVLTESVLERAMIPPRSSPAARKLSIGNSFSINLTPGRYRMQFEIRDTASQGSLTETLTVRDLRHVPSISDPIIGSSVVRLPSGLISVVPMANRTFGPSGLHEMYVYVAGYDFAGKGDRAPRAESSQRGQPVFPETLAHELGIAILDSTGRTVKTLPTEQHKRTSSGISEIFGLSSQGLTPGAYQLRVSLRDLVNDSTATTGKWFYVTGSTSPAMKLDTLSMTAEERRAYTDIRYLATAREMGEYNSLSREGKFEWLAMKFWPQHDFETYYQRLQVADERFKYGARLGRNTDEGRIYLRYGEPDDIEHHAMVEQTLSHEHWHYYRLGYHFIFVDVNSDGRLKLVYSNTDAEPKAQNWEKLVDPMELPDLEEK